MLQVNDAAPDFTLPATGGGSFQLSAQRGKKVVLYFYPKDDTPGCTVEACDFRDNMARIKSHGAQVYGVSKDTLASHAKFRGKFELPFELLSDEGNKIARLYGAYGKKLMYGKPVEGTIRSTFLIDEKGRVAAVWSPVKVDGHVDAVIAALQGEKAASDMAKKSAAKKAASKAAGASAKSSTKAPAKTTKTTKASAAKAPAAKSLLKKAPAKKTATKRATSKS